MKILQHKTHSRLVLLFSLALFIVTGAEQKNNGQEKLEVPNSGPITHFYLFSEAGQKFDFNHIQFRSQTLNARLYQKASGSLAPVSGAFQVTFDELGNTTLTLDFPKRRKRSEYLIILESPVRSFVSVTSLPLDELENLRAQTEASPIVLSSPSSDLVDSLNSLGLTFSQDTTMSEKPIYRIVDNRDAFFKGAPDTKFKAQRTLIINPSLSQGQEIWKSSKPKEWQIHLSPSVFPEFHTKAAQAHLLHFLLTNPL